MAKKSRKQRKEAKPTVLPAVTLLRPKLDKWLTTENIQHKAIAEITQKFDEFQQDVKIEGFFNILLGSYSRASKETQSRLDDALATWLTTQEDRLDSLYKIVENHKVTGTARETAFLWLTQGGADITKLQQLELATPFYKAFFQGNEWQSMLVICYYLDHRKQRATGIVFLIDGNPPWYGSVKDVFTLPRREPEKVIAAMLKRMRSLERPQPKELTENKAKTKIINALLNNHKRKIRLSRDFIRLRGTFLSHILALEGDKGTPEFDAEDFDELCDKDFGRSADEIMDYENNVGRLIEDDDGREIFIDARTVRRMMDGDDDFFDDDDDYYDDDDDYYDDDDDDDYYDDDDDYYDDDDDYYDDDDDDDYY